MNRAKENKLSFLEKMGLFSINVAVSLYLTFLFKILWNWFLVSKLFEVGYWELFLGLALVRFMVSSKSNATTSIRLNKELGDPTLSERLNIIGGSLVFHTLAFGIFYIVKLIFVSL